MDIKGWVRTSLIDFPGHIATVVFTGGCNFRCPMCHNADLVLHPGSLPSIDLDELWAFLEKRAGRITGVVVTGGEPTLQPDLPAFLAEVRKLGCAIKLDSNGYRPNTLANLLQAGLVDYVAMDVKAPPGKYAVLTGVPELDLSRIEASLAVLHEAQVSCEFRTTVVPGMLNDDDIVEIAKWLSTIGTAPGAAYVLQQFRGQHTLDPELADATPYASDVLRRTAKRAQAWLPNVSCRGI
ncbi:MAG: anaerobic ribonucleoside-triphosphate reductase activating protein [Anaerolineae bacterium]|nr:anaerobic ribonucleoside-triphosphate reductase activating protein [Anaerolineae bacterium]